MAKFLTSGIGRCSIRPPGRECWLCPHPCIAKEPVGSNLNIKNKKNKMKTEEKMCFAEVCVNDAVGATDFT